MTMLFERLRAELRAMIAMRTRLAREKTKVWGLPLAIIVTFIALELLVGNLLAIAISYLALFIFILNFGLIEQSTPLRRGGTYALGSAALCFGSGRLIYWFHGGVLTDSYEWLFDTGHLSLIIACVLTVLDLRSRLKVTPSPCKNKGSPDE